MDRVIYFVVGDKKLNSGNGIYVDSLEKMKARLLKKRIKGAWRLVISMHGAEDVIATRGGNLKNKDAEGVYDADDIRKLFNDDGFGKWREKYGPTWTTLNSCQVNSRFEAAILKAFNKPASKQKAQGLGQGCRPHTEIQHYYGAGSDRPVRTRAQWRRLSKSDKKGLEEVLTELNEKFGYFGGPSVPEAQLLDYYFEEEPKGGWPVVTVSVNRVDTGISFNKRTQNARFLGKKCTQHLGPLRGRRPSAPPPI